MNDPVNNPKHYTEHPSGVECIDIVKFENYCVGNAIKYIWRHRLKGKRVEDLQKAIFYLNQQIKIYETEEFSGERIRDANCDKA